MIGKLQISEPAWKHKASFVSFSFQSKTRGPPTIKDPFQIPLLSYCSWAPTRTKNHGAFPIDSHQELLQISVPGLPFWGVETKDRGKMVSCMRSLGRWCGSRLSFCCAPVKRVRVKTFQTHPRPIQHIYDLFNSATWKVALHQGGPPASQSMYSNVVELWSMNPRTSNMELKELQSKRSLGQHGNLLLACPKKVCLKPLFIGLLMRKLQKSVGVCEGSTWTGLPWLGFTFQVPWNTHREKQSQWDRRNNLHAMLPFQQLMFNVPQSFHLGLLVWDGFSFEIFFRMDHSVQSSCINTAVSWLQYICFCK